MVNELDGETLTTRDGDPEDLEVGRDIEAIGELSEVEGETCLSATELIVEAESEV